MINIYISNHIFDPNIQQLSQNPKNYFKWKENIKMISSFYTVDFKDIIVFYIK